MKTVSITRDLCVFDDDANTIGLSVCTKPDGYKTLVYSSGPYVHKYYCRILMNASPTEEVDHINGDTLDNRRCNLRLVSSQQNKFNTAVRKTKTSGLPKGVSKHGPSYRAAICWKYQIYYLGVFPTVELAEKAYKEAAVKFQGEHAAHLSRVK